MVCAKRGDSKIIHILDEALRICLACGESRVEAEWHGSACARIEARELELRQELETILSAVSSHKPAGLHLKSNGILGALGMRTTLLGRRASKSLDLRSWSRRICTVLRQANRRSGAQRVQGASQPPVKSAMLNLSGTGEGPSDFDLAIGRNCENPVHDGAPPNLVVYCLGPFQVYQGDDVISDWPNSKSKSVFKYLITHRERPVAKEVLMEVFWPDADAGRARNSLNVAIYRIRRALSERRYFSYVLYQNDCYLLNPELDVWTDYEEFTAHIDNARAMERLGDESSVVQEYRAAEALYGGELLEEDRYEEWVNPMRDRLQRDYLAILDRLCRNFFSRQDYDTCVTFCNKILAIDACQEDAHRLIMRCHSRQKRPNLATRQFHFCVRTLERELGVEPSRTTVELDQRIRNHEAV